MNQTGKRRYIVGSGFNGVPGSGSRGAKIFTKIEKSLEILCFEVLDVFF
jgi:hypothetical protein